MKICLFTAFTSNLEAEGAISIPVNRSYAARHGYDFIAYTSDSDFDYSRELNWSKILLLKRTLVDYDWVMWIDHDALVMNPTIKLESFIEDNLIGVCSKSWVGEPLCGTMLLRNCPESMDLLSKMWASYYLGGNFYNREEGALQSILQCSPNYAANFKLVKQKDINAFDFNLPDYRKWGFHSYPYGQYEAGDFILHFALIQNKIELMKSYANNHSICG